jgi:hypothetical protein
MISAMMIDDPFFYSSCLPMAAGSEVVEGTREKGESDF